MSTKAEEIKSREEYESARKRLESFLGFDKPNAEQVIGAIKDMIRIELVNAAHSDRIEYEIEALAGGLTELFNKSAHSFASLTTLMHYLKDVGLGPENKLDPVKYQEVFEEKVIKPFQSIQKQIDQLEKSGDPFNDASFGVDGTFDDKPPEQG